MEGEPFPYVSLIMKTAHNSCDYHYRERYHVPIPEGCHSILDYMAMLIMVMINYAINSVDT